MGLLESYCRLCASKELQMVSVFDGNETKKCIVDEIRIHFNILIRENDLLPSKICIFCLETLDRFSDFVRKCQATQIHLQKLLTNLEKNEEVQILQNKNEQISNNNVKPLNQSLRKLSVCIPRLPLSRSFIQGQLEYDRVILDLDKPDSIASEKRNDQFFSNNEIKEEIKEEISTEDLTSFSVDCSENSKLNWKTVNKFEELLRTAVLDIPLEPGSCKEIENNCQLSQNSSILKQLNDNMNKNNACSLKHIISNIFDSQDVTVNNEDNMINVTFKPKSQNSKVEVQSNCATITYNTMQLPDFFPNYNIRTNLKKLGAEIFSKHLPGIINSAQFQLNYEDLKSMLSNTESYMFEKIEKNQNICDVVTDSCATSVDMETSNTEIMGPCFPLPVPCTVELVDIKKEVKETRMDVLLDKSDQYVAESTGKIVPEQSLLELKTPMILLKPLNENMISAKLQHKADDESLIEVKEDDSIEVPVKVSKFPVSEEETPYTKSTSYKDIKNTRFFLREHTELKNPLTCDSCNLCCKRRINYCKHLTEKHNKSNSKNNEDLFSCEICGKQFTKKSFTLHKKLEHTKSVMLNFKCEFCDTTFSRHDLLKVHIQQHSTTRPYLCAICNMNFANRFQLSLHKSRKHIEKKLKCSYCSYVAAHQYRLTQHEKEVHNKRFECGICGKKLGKKSKIAAHIQRDHTECSPIKCYHCNLVFTQRYDYKEHLKTNLSGNRFPCVYCGNEFDKQYKLLMHVSKTHERSEIKCTQCSFTTLHKYQLKQHKREVHEKSFVCDICGKLESKKCRILVHIRNKHTTKKVFHCKLCNATYNSKNWYIEHLKKHP